MSEKKSWFSVLKARFSRTINDADASFQSLVNSTASISSEIFENTTGNDDDSDLEKKYLAVDFSFAFVVK